MAQFNVTELDFDKIKQNLIEYYKTYPDSKYKDYDFEGAGLNVILDILAYNTHYNAVLAHSSVNESFLDSAQIRANVVSKAKSLGYFPNSISAPSCTLNITFDGSINANAESYTLESGKKVSTKLDDVTYTFTTTDNYTTTLESGNYQFKDVKFYQGTLKKKRYVVRDANNKQKYIIKDASADISTLSVKIFDNSTSSAFSIFKRSTTFNDISDESEIYFMSENHEGNYEIEFGNGVYGRSPSGQNIIEFQYLSTLGSAANSATVFSWASGSPTPTELLLTSRSAGGAEREDIESIRFNAPLTYAAQERAVTVDDYVALINRDFPSADIVSVWGGQDQFPPQYGKVFISIKPKSENFLTDSQKVELMSLLKSKNVAATIPEIVNPEFMYLYFETFFKYNSNVTDLTQSNLESKVRDTLVSYNSSSLSSFNTAFRYSKFLKAIDECDNSITGSTVRVFAYKTKRLVVNDTISTTFDFGFELFGDIVGDESFISSDSFTYNGSVLKLADENQSSTQRNVYAYRIDSLGNKVAVLSSIGTLTPSTGKIQFNPIPSTANADINIYVKPASNDVAVKRNNLLQIDTDKTTIVGSIDSITTSGIAGAINFETVNR
jgi:hypothetical protein